MSITLGSNIASLRGQRQLSSTSKELGTVFERLSSGQRINSAGDDAAGLAIAEALKADTAIFNQGVRNLADGLSLLTIADGAIESLVQITTRLEELASQAANGTYGAEQREALDKEAQALKDEFFRITKSTEFNDRNLFDGSTGSLTLQAGAGENATIEASLGGAIGTGTLETEVQFGSSIGSALSAIAAGDFNNDGSMDLVAGGGSTPAQVLLGTSGGGFEDAIALATASEVSDVQVADLNSDGNVNSSDHDFLVRNVLGTTPGDANLDGIFNSSDLIQIFAAGKFETGESAGWADGDWDCDGLFATSDLIAAFQRGDYTA